MSIQSARQTPKRKTFWLKQLHTWHWMSSAVSLVGLLLFAVTGFTLNHAADIEAKPTIRDKAAQLPAPLFPLVAAKADAPDEKKPLPPAVARWVEQTFPESGPALAPASPPTSGRGDADWTATEIYLGLPRPGGDGWVSIDRASGAVTSEFTDRGWISYLNDLHKGRNSGAAWKWFIDVFAFACLVFAATGLVLLWLHAAKRRSTWPLVLLGLAIPAAIATFLIH